MKLRKLMLFAACAAVATVSCSPLEPYTIDAPSDLKEKIAEYEAEKAAGQSDDYTEIPITVAIAGAEDNSSGWWTEFSQYFAVPSGKKLFLEFENYGSGANNWNNWNVCVTNPYERGADAYSEYFVLRSDWYGWGNADYNASVIEFDYGGGEVNWDEFREKMQGAYVTMSLDHAKGGVAYLEVHSVATDGFDIVEKYNQSVSSTEDVNLFLIADASHFNVKKAYLVPSEVGEIPDYEATSIEVTGHPLTIPLGEEDYWGNAVATVTFEDGFTTEVEKEALTILEPDLSTTGTKTVVYSYNLTKLGKPGKAVVGYYNLEVTDLASIAVTSAPYTTTYYVYDAAVPFYTEGLVVTGYKADGSTVILDNSALSFDMVQPEAGLQEVTIDFSGISTTCPVTVKQGIEAIGAPDFSNAWWTTFLSADKPVPAGESTTIHLFVYSDNLANWHSPCTILRGAALNEYAVVRMDAFGWGDGYASATIEHDWNFDLFAANQNMSAVSITVTNNGDNTADVVYGVTHATGETHFQRYLGVGVNSDDLQVGIVTEESYLIVLEEAAVDAKLLSISATATANLVGGASIVTLSNEAVEVRANYSDGTSVALNPADCTLSFTDGQLVYSVTPGSSLKVGSAEYTPAGGEILQADVMLVAKASAQEGQTTQVGAGDFSGAWFDNGYLTASKNWTVAPGTSETVRLTLGSDNALNFHSPSVVLHNTDAEYCVVRMDHFGWGGSYESAVVTSNWNWETFAPTLNGSVIDITVANDGAGKASIRYHVISSDDSEHFQYYDGIPVSGDDVQFFVATEGAYLVFE